MTLKSFFSIRRASILWIGALLLCFVVSTARGSTGQTHGKSLENEEPNKAAPNLDTGSYSSSLDGFLDYEARRLERMEARLNEHRRLLSQEGGEGPELHKKIRNLQAKMDQLRSETMQEKHEKLLEARRLHSEKMDRMMKL